VNNTRRLAPGFSTSQRCAPPDAVAEARLPRRISHQDFQLLGLIGEIGWMPVPGITVEPIGSAVRRYRYLELRGKAICRTL
jgi:hypothetical protein